MKKYSIMPFIFLLIFTNGSSEVRESRAVKNKIKPQAELLLRKIVGGMPEDAKGTKVYDCKLNSSDLPDVPGSKKLIDQLPQETILGMHIVATSPSLQILAYKNGKEIVILRDGSQILQANARKETEKRAVEELRSYIDKLCPTP